MVVLKPIIFISMASIRQSFGANQDPISVYYGTATDVAIKLAQDTTADEIERFKIRTFLQALLSLSGLIPTFLISARVVSKPLALIAVVLLLITPTFFGHAFINPKDSIFASGYLWAIYLIVHCFDEGRKPKYSAIIGLGVLLGLVISLRFTGAYLLLLIPFLSILLSAWRNSRMTASFRQRLWRQSTLHFPGLLVVLITCSISYVLLMPAILADFRAGALIHAVGTFVRPRPWPEVVLYFGENV